MTGISRYLEKILSVLENDELNKSSLKSKMKQFPESKAFMEDVRTMTEQMKQAEVFSDCELLTMVVMAMIEGVGDYNASF